MSEETTKRIVFEALNEKLSILKDELYSINTCCIQFKYATIALEREIDDTIEILKELNS